MNSFKTKLFASAVMLVCVLSLHTMCIFGAHIQSVEELVPTNRLIDTPEYDCYDLGVATFNVLDYGVDNSGNRDCTALVQKLLDACGGVNDYSRGDYRNSAGGTLYFPAGRYLFKGQITIPRGVSIRGDWKNPQTCGEVKGTVFAVKPTYGKGGVSQELAFITMQPSTLVTNISFWYPDQNPNNIVEYPATILYGQTGYWGNDYCNVRHCTFVNSYIAIQFNTSGSGGCPNIFDIYGTPLFEGFEMDRIADVGRFDGIHFSADYWEKSGLPGSPSVGQIDDWLYNNATAVVMRRNDWSYTCNLDVEGYMVGFHAEKSPFDSSPNGHNYGFNLRRCRTGILLTGVSGSGIMFTNISTPQCSIGVSLPNEVDGPVQFYGCEIDGTAAAIQMGEEASSELLFQNCNITGVTNVLGGHFQAVDNTFEKNVNVAAMARILFNDNKFKLGGSLNNRSFFKCEVNKNTACSYPELPSVESSWMEIRKTMPAKKMLYVVTDSEFGAKPFTDNTLEPASRPDCANAIQKALDEAGAAGGGIVYLPTGHYPCKTNLIIPEGVELKGSSDLATVPKNHGAVIEVLTGEGNDKASPFITMGKNSGLRGVSINYPAQKDPMNVKPYPYTIRGNADCYVVNVALRAAYRGLDLFTNKCDNHYVDYLAGHAFMNVARIGGDSQDGVFSNCQCNTIVYACGDESKFGSWPNSMAMKDDNVQQQAYCQNERDLNFLIVGDCTREFLYNNFLFGCAKGMWFISDNHGGANNCRSLGNAVDGAIQTFVIDGISTNLNLVNSQIVALDHDPENSKHRAEVSDYISAYFIKTGEGLTGKTINFFSSNLWGSGDYMTDIKTGRVNLVMTNMMNSGAVSTFKTSKGAKISVFNGKFKNVNRTLYTPADGARVSVVSSVVDFKGDERPAAMNWNYNLTSGWELSDNLPIETRTGWTATASTNDIFAMRAIDGDSSSRWDTSSSQVGNEWFEVDFNSMLTFNMVILDSSASGANDGPAGYKVEAYTTNGWQELAIGEKGGSMCMVTFDKCTASKVRVSQTGAKSNYWSINEFFVANVTMPVISEVEDIICYETKMIIKNDQLIASDENIDILEVFDINGRLIYLEEDFEGIMDISQLESGVYVAIAKSAKGISILKFAK